MNGESVRYWMRKAELTMREETPLTYLKAVENGTIQQVLLKPAVRARDYYVVALSNINKIYTPEVLYKTDNPEWSMINTVRIENENMATEEADETLYWAMKHKETWTENKKLIMTEEETDEVLKLIDETCRKVENLPLITDTDEWNKGITIPEAPKTED